jgi:1-pyrroline-5-carboxylate dehydrogenase
MSTNGFKLTYATMFNPPEEMHTLFEQALAKVKANLGQEYAMIVDGKEHFSFAKFENRNPANTDVVLGMFQTGTAQDAETAIDAARRAFPGWSRLAWQERVRLLRKAASLMDERTYEIAAVIALEVGKNRTEALGDVAETADLFRYACDRMEANHGYVMEMGHDPLSGFQSSNFSALRPYGVWVVVSPFNFPCALTGGPAAAALVTGNTIVIKPASDTPWTSRLIAECLRDAGLPDGSFNYVTGPGGTLGQALIDSPEVNGITFTGSFDVGMKIYRDFSQGRWPRPTILEMGGKNPAIVSRNADLETAATGILRSAFGLQGQKCSACSRILVEDAVYDQLVERLVELTRALTIGDPTERGIYLGPVVNRSSYRDYQNFCEDLNQHGQILTGGKALLDGDYVKGYFCAPTLVADLPYDHPLWKQEMFVPISTIGRVKSLEEAMNLANEVEYGLTAGFYGNLDEAEWFYDRIEAGVTYVNRPQGATTGA